MHSYLNGALSQSFVMTDGTEPIANAGGQHYVPTSAVCYAFLVLFVISTVFHLFQAIYFRKFFMIPTVVAGGFLEVAGWGGRVWMSINLQSRSAFIMQSTALVLGPTPLVAANFVILGRIISVLGPRYSRLTPKFYAAVFCASDVISLLVQGAGGGIAAGAGSDMDKASLGSNIVLAGTVFQLGVMVLYAAFKAEFLVRYAQNWPLRNHIGRKNPMDMRIKVILCALVFNTTCLIIRSIYRIIEFADGWDGRIVNTEIYFNILDGMMVTFAIYALNLAHPGYLLPSQTLASGSTIELDGIHVVGEARAKGYNPVDTNEQPHPSRSS